MQVQQRTQGDVLNGVVYQYNQATGEASVSYVEERLEGFQFMNRLSKRLAILTEARHSRHFLRSFA